MTPKIIAVALLSQSCSLEKAPDTKIGYGNPATDYSGDDDNKNPTKKPPQTQEIFLAKANYSNVLKSIQSDVLKTNPSDQIKLRYFTLYVASNAGRGSVDLDLLRKGFAKTINSLSTKNTIVKPVAIDADKTIYRVNLDDLNISVEVFDKVMAEHYPFNNGFNEIGDTESLTNQQIDASNKSLIKSDNYAIRIDWFNATAPLPILYAKLMEHPDNLSDFEEKVLGSRVAVSSLGNNSKKVSSSLFIAESGVNKVDKRIANIVQDQVLRSGFDNSDIALNNRILERHSIAEGSYYITYDFIGLKVGDPFTDARGRSQLADAGDVSDRTIVQSPLGPKGTNGSNLEFNHDGDEVIYTLPNGLLGFYVADGSGTRIDKEQTRLIKDVKVGPGQVKQAIGPDEFGQAVVNGISCMSCHNTGLLTQKDTILDGIKRGKSNLATADLSRINKIYNATELTKTIVNDNKRFAAAMAEIGISPSEKDPVDASFRFYNRPLGKKDVIAELDISLADFNRLLVDPQFSGAFNALKNETGFINRGVFNAIYPTVVAKFKAELNHIAPLDDDFVVTLDCMVADITFMDKCVVSPVVLKLSAFR